MKKNLVAFFLCLMLVIGIMPTATFAKDLDVWDGSSAKSFSGGTGTVEDPYQIASGAQLSYLSDSINVKNSPYISSNFILTKDIDLAGREWLPIGNGNNVVQYFGGTFDGQGHYIYNLTSAKKHFGSGSQDPYDTSKPANPYHGLFGIISNDGMVKNLGLVDAKVSVEPGDGSTDMGILASWVNNSSIINCSTSGTITSDSGVSWKLIGGLVGQCTGYSNVIGCYSTATVNSIKKNAAEDDTVGGLIGQWETSANNSLISDCWFDGKINCTFKGAAVGGILGANLDYERDATGVKVNNCFIYTTDITSIAPENITWIAAAFVTPIEKCYWPIDNKLTKQHRAVVKLKLDVGGGTASIDPNFDQSKCGNSVTDFLSPTLLSDLKTNAHPKVTWVSGINHPTFSWDTCNIAADYTKVDAAIAGIPGDLSVYTKETAKAVTDALDAVIRGKNVTEQGIVDGYATAINNAVKALVKKEVLRYKDVSDGLWSAHYIYDLTSQGILNGYENKYFYPENNITRGEYCKIMFVSANGNVKANSAKVAFADTKDNWSNGYVLWAKEKNIVKGNGNNEFLPDADISREESATMLSRYALNIGDNNLSANNGMSTTTANLSSDKVFTDSDKISPWAKDAVNLLHKAGVINGYEDNSYRPDKNITRGESAKMFSEFLKRMK
ncbi:MAG: S-layer homology domain-containing protein [Clostridiales bacterium]